jgi:hypothetical protein
VLTKIHAELVPDQLPYELFWQRYYFRTSRTSINLGGDGDTSDEEDLGWDEEDEEDDNDNQKGGEASNVQAMVWATVSPPLPLTSLSSASATGQQQERGGGQGCGKAVGGKATGEPSNLATSLPGDLKALAALEERVNVLEGDLSEARRDAESAKAAEAAARIELQKLSAAFDKQQASHKAAVVAASEEAEKRVVSAAAAAKAAPSSFSSAASASAEQRVATAVAAALVEAAAAAEARQVAAVAEEKRKGEAKCGALLESSASLAEELEVLRSTLASERSAAAATETSLNARIQGLLLQVANSAATAGEGSAAAADDDHDPGSDGSGLSGELVHASEAVGASPLPPASSPAAERTPALGDDSDEEEDGAWGDDWN